MTNGNLGKKEIKPLTIILAIIFLIAGMMGCSGSSSDDTGAAAGTKTVKQRKVTNNSEEETAKASSPEGGWIKRAYFTPCYDNNLGKALKINVETTVPKTGDQYFVYYYWNNFHRVAEKPEEDNIIPYSSFKTGDYLYVDVLLYQDGELLQKKRSAGLLVKNTAPIIEEVDIPEIDGPGTYQIPITASDAEGDKLVFSLEGKPLFSGLQIDKETGTVTCTLGAEPPPPEMKFTIIAKDEKGGITKKVVSIFFKISNAKES